MSSNKDKPTDATEDDDFGDFEGPEDDAPESVQAMAGPPNWVFPDLLRVDSGQATHEEPESLLNNGPIVANNSRPNVMIRAPIRETGAIPKQRTDLPDVSLLTTARDLCTPALKQSSYSREPTATSSHMATTSMNRPSTLIDVNTHNGSVDSNHIRVNRLEQDVKTLQTQKALLQQQLLQKDTQIRELHSQSRQSVPNVIPTQSNEALITTLTETVDRFRTNIETAMSRLEQRLSSLETRVINANDSSIVCETVSTNGNDIDSHAVRQTSSQTLNSILIQQKKEIENERRRNLLLFSSLLKNAYETIETHLGVKDLEFNHK
ncbi:unnamed protein product [Medioppia subpectinata]|uniref:Uncharacterized protein n=1 Tax=Medioppia subpectinata TaxID=1979941 RepID=A0A7R9L0D4_9ACAR|nr:unnamed protein product [Medioppia subpectinata]CAG2112953.1 unnamed protein product [Medioppia subpectinata]